MQEESLKSENILAEIKVRFRLNFNNFILSKIIL